jgi:hypothetical protein
METHTLDSHLHTVIYTRCHINTIDSPDDEHRGAQSMYRTGINIYEKRIVHQVGYLQELHGDMMFRLFYGSHIKKNDYYKPKDEHVNE